MNDIVDMVYRSIARPVFDDRLGERDHATGVFERHVEEVRATVPGERLLTYDVRQGWAPLCAFLGVDIPEMDFPRTNSSREFGESVAEQSEK